MSVFKPRKPPKQPKLARMGYPLLEEVRYSRRLESYSTDIYQIAKRVVLPAYKATVNRLWPDLEKQDGASIEARTDDAIDDVFEALIKAIEAVDAKFPAELLEKWTKEHFRKVDIFQHARWNDLAEKYALGVDPLAGEPWLAAKADEFTTSNVALIKSIKEKHFSELEASVRKGVQEGVRYSDMANTFEARYGVSKSKAKLIARDQTGKLYGEINQARQEEAGITSYIWRTSMDERVRDEHAEREGQEFEWCAPPDDGHPGKPIQCRCEAEPVLPK